MNNNRFAIIGAGGHCKVVIDILCEIGEYQYIDIYDDHKKGYICGIPIINPINKILKDKPNGVIIAIGDDLFRKYIYETFTDLPWKTLIHPKACVSKSAVIKTGTIVCANAVIQPEVYIGNHCIINTNCNIDHETVIDDFCSICPGTTICGQVKIGKETFIGANSTIIQNILIGNNCIIGAGSVIIRNIDDNQKFVGNPGKKIC